MAGRAITGTRRRVARRTAAMDSSVPLAGQPPISLPTRDQPAANEPRDA
jgi:hypothetical protein